MTAWLSRLLCLVPAGWVFAFAISWSYSARRVPELSESNSVIIQNHDREFIVKRIAGAIARRTVCQMQSGDMLEKGQRYGLILFGLHVDLVLSRYTDVVVQVGDIVKGGETILAVLKEPQGV